MTDPDSSQSVSDAPAGETAVRVSIYKRRWFWVLYAVVLVVSIAFAVFQVHRFFTSQGSNSSAGTFSGVRRGHGRIGPPAAPPTSGPSEMTDNPLAGVGMKPLGDDPDGIRPPRGAVRRSAFVREADNEVEMMATYGCQGHPDQAAEHYKEHLIARGLKLLGDRIHSARSATTRAATRPSARSRRVLVFRGPKCHVTVTLRKVSGDDTRLSIALIVVRRDS